MPGLTLFDGQIGDDGTAKLRLAVRRDFDSGHPFALDLNDDTWPLTLDTASRLARAGERIRWALEGAAPKAEPYFRRKINFGDEMVMFELGIDAPTGVYLSWDDKRVVSVNGDLLRLLERIGEQVRDIRQATRL
jgi:hypothetical protein